MKNGVKQIPASIVILEDNTCTQLFEETKMVMNDISNFLKKPEIWLVAEIIVNRAWLIDLWDELSVAWMLRGPQVAASSKLWLSCRNRNKLSIRSTLRVVQELVIG